MTVLIFGGTGQVGWELQRSLAPLGPIVAPQRAVADCAQPETLAAAIRDASPSIIVNAAAYTAVDQAKKEPELARLINVTAPRALAEEAERLRIPLIHYSTDYVFDGRKDAPYTEDDQTAPLNVYGQTKLDGERAVAEACRAYMTFRTSWVYATRGKNFLRTILRLATERDRLAIVNDQVGAPTWARMIAQATALALARCRRPDGTFDVAPASGLYHLTAAGETTWHGFAQAILKLDPKKSTRRVQAIDAISTAAFGAPEPRPANSRLNTDRLYSAFGIRLPDWEYSLRQAMEELTASE